MGRTWCWVGAGLHPALVGWGESVRFPVTVSRFSLFHIPSSLPLFHRESTFLCPLPRSSSSEPECTLGAGSWGDGDE